MKCNRSVMVMKKNVKRNQKNGKKWLTFRLGFVIIILALSDRAKLIKSH